jgi:hypothetical protein
MGRPVADQQSESIEFVPKRELQRAQQELERLRKQSERLQKENERLKQETERLRRELEAALRASKRQAAPHSRGNPKTNPQRPGRKPGGRYGRQACRPIPRRVDERITVPLPKRCPHCGGGVEPESCETQYQEEIVRRTIVRLPPKRAGTPLITDLRCRGSRQRAVGTGGADPGGHSQQTDGALAGTYTPSSVLWVRTGG